MKLKQTGDRLIMDASSRVLRNTLLLSAILAIYVSILLDFLSSPADAAVEFSLATAFAAAVSIWAVFGNLFVSSLIIDSDGIHEKRFFVITCKRCKWQEFEGYFFEPYSPYRYSSEPPFRRAVFEKRTASGKIRKTTGPYYPVRFADEYEKTIDCFCEKFRG